MAGRREGHCPRARVPQLPRGPLQYPDRRIDEYLGDWAKSRPDGIALWAETGPVTFDELDVAVTTASSLLKPIARGGVVIAVASTLDSNFVVAYQMTLRSGNIVAPINPLAREASLADQLGTVRAQIAFVTKDMHDRIHRIRDDMDRLPELIVVDGGPDALLDGLRRLNGAEFGDPSNRAKRWDPSFQSQRVATIHFTSGTTGKAKAVQLTHRNVTANALQVADAHRLTTSDVMLVNFPTYHPMHMNAGLVSGATQVLCPSADALAAVELAQARRATHLYSMPVYLNRLAIDARIERADLSAARLLASGGSALMPAVAQSLSARFGIPIVQGYGLAETAPLTHFDVPESPKPGSVGPAVADTDCRIVDIDTREPLGIRDRGEVQVRGPQVMKGYLGERDGTAIDGAGWFSTGDVGYLDEESYLFLVDRIKDVFKCDNWLVAPTEIEAVLSRHPAVRDCAVVDRHDSLSGAVPHAYVVLQTSDAAQVPLQRIVDFANGQLADFQRIRSADLLPVIPRSANGKIMRTLLRADLQTIS